MREEPTYQALLDAYTQRGHEVLALEQKVERLTRERDWYREACEECWRFNPSNKY